MTAGATVLTWMPRLAHSMASRFVAALRPPFVSDGKGRAAEFSSSTTLVVICMTWPLPCFCISAMASCVIWKKPAILIFSFAA